MELVELQEAMVQRELMALLLQVELLELAELVEAVVHLRQQEQVVSVVVHLLINLTI